MPWRGNEGFTHLPAQFCTYGDILQVGIRRCEPSGNRPGLVKGSMHPPSSRIDLRWKRIYVSGLEFGKFPVFQNPIDYRVNAAQRLQYIGGGGIETGLRALGAVRRGDCQLIE